MIPRTTGYRLPGEMSAGFSALRRQLPGGGEGAPSDALGPISALGELAAVVRRDFISPQDGESLRIDVNEALGAMGVRTRHACEGELGRLLARIRDLRACIKDPEGRTALLVEIDALTVHLRLKALEGRSCRQAPCLRSDRRQHHMDVAVGAEPHSRDHESAG
jgi:hypothetical protein